jgi:hypothetical protein
MRIGALANIYENRDSDRLELQKAGFGLASTLGPHTSPKMATHLPGRKKIRLNHHNIKLYHSHAVWEQNDDQYGGRTRDLGVPISQRILAPRSNQLS